ncbi:hypothetical protein ACJ73_00913 [Blastomyces percursus]|uniref:Reverse transcriptase zinc-binding domain-containing protein n=1 Tax=Blastomyces percursus TaxID=1658174 RepID=A0A1J9RGL7_9EURO|nr:hypothetical protein ACJ73_00913 [Blastomyces percursus]
MPTGTRQGRQAYQPPGGWRLDPEAAQAPKRVARLYYQFKTGHAPTAEYLHRIGARGSPRCGECSDGHETVAHLLFNCRQWRRQREALFKALDEAKVIRPGPTEEAPEARLFADRKATKALLEYIGAITAQRSEQQAAEEALRADCWGIEAMEEGDREGEG